MSTSICCDFIVTRWFFELVLLKKVCLKAGFESIGLVSIEITSWIIQRYVSKMNYKPFEKNSWIIDFKHNNLICQLVAMFNLKAELTKNIIQKYLKSEIKILFLH